MTSFYSVAGHYFQFFCYAENRIRLYRKLVMLVMFKGKLCSFNSYVQILTILKTLTALFIIILSPCLGVIVAIILPQANTVFHFFVYFILFFKTFDPHAKAKYRRILFRFTFHFLNLILSLLYFRITYNRQVPGTWQV